MEMKSVIMTDVSYLRWSWNQNNTNFTMCLVSRKITSKEGAGREKPVELFSPLSVSQFDVKNIRKAYISCQ